MQLLLKSFQEQAIDFLLENTNFDQNKITLHAPTGSGKTIILISYIERYLDNHNDTVFIWLTPGKGELEEQSKEKMERLTKLDCGTLQDALISEFKAGYTYFINWEKITKKDNNAISDTEKANLFDRIKRAHNKQLKFILIIDEEHQNNTSKAKDIIMAISADSEIRVSATPTKTKNKYYEINEIDAINEELITKALYINYELNPSDTSSVEIETELLLEKAESLRREIKEEYEKKGENINPLVLVQFPNNLDNLIIRVEKYLEKLGYTYENGLLASWFSKKDSDDEEVKKKLDKINLGTQKENDIKNHDAKQAFLLFKQAIATGWDCPRAKILIKLRENMSDTFSIQTIGRIRRMPRAKHYGVEKLDCSFIYTFDEEFKSEVINSGGYETQRVFLKEEPRKIKLVKELKNKDNNNADEKDIRDRFYNFWIEKYNLKTDKKENQKRLENNGFIFGNKIKGSILQSKVIQTKELANIEKIKELEIFYEVNTHLHGIELQYRINYFKNTFGLDYARTRKLLENLFRSDVGNKRKKIINLNLKEFYAFIINNFDKLKYDMKDFEAIKYKQQSLINHKTLDFKIPLEENYRIDQTAKIDGILDKNVYHEYSISMISSPLRSQSERLFEKYCENNPNVKYVYKNGDTGQQYLSIVYFMNNGIERNFYPDYIVILKDERIFLIETKGGEANGISKNIDKQVENKFQEFKRFSETHNYNFAFVRDIDGNLFYNNTEYVEDMKDKSWKELKELF